jgi:hypothetical protein
MGSHIPRMKNAWNLDTNPIKEVASLMWASIPAVQVKKVSIKNYRHVTIINSSWLNISGGAPPYNL